MKTNEHVKDLLNSKNILITDKKCTNRHAVYDENECLNHIYNIVYIQQKLLECREPFSLGLTSSIWNEIEELKVWNRRARYILSKKNILEVETVVNEAEACINAIYDLDYIQLIKRAMNRNEICLGKPYESNLFRDDKLKIIDISKISFNMIEHDCYKYLSRLKRKGIKLEWETLIEYFVQKHELKSESKAYILALLSYPYDSMRFIQQYYISGIREEKEFLKKLNEINSCF